MIDRVGQQLGNYRLIRLLGRGTLAEVYLGEHLHLNTQVAVKMLHTQLTSQDREWLRTEARTLARLMHPHIVRILDFGVEDDIPFLVMEYAPKGTLRQHYPKGTLLPLAHIVSYTKQVAGALQYAHEQGVIHCDVRPANLVFGRNQEILLTDFGLATRTQSSSFQQIWQASGDVAYTAPEQLQGHPGSASDQYALGVAVYEWLSGDPPFSGSSAEITRQHLSASPLALRTKVPTISAAIEQVVLKVLAKDPELRFASVQIFAMALEEASRTEMPGRMGFVPSSGHSDEDEQMRSSLSDFPRGTVTLLFADIEGSTHLLEQLGDRYALVLAECRHLLRVAFQRWSGHEVDTQGDGFFVAFARATDAITAAVDAQRVLASHSWPEGLEVRIRMGLHTGEPSLTPEGYVGLDVHRAARIMSAGHGGQVLLSQTTCNLVEYDLTDDVSLRDLGEYRLKDLGRPRHLFQLVISGLPADFPPLRTLDTYPNNLPIQSTAFTGREQEVATVQQLLRRKDARLLTLTGTGGTGKTRLGMQVAAELSDDFADGMFFVDLAPISDPALVVPTIAQTLGIREASGLALLDRLKEDLQHKQLLLLLDNFEQVVVAAPQVADLLAACPQLKVMVTSREVLHVRAEHEFTVPALEMPDPNHLPDPATLSHYAAVALFLQRAQAVKPDFQMTHANARTITEICFRLDGLPLTIELAAARMKLLSPQSLLARLDRRLHVLTSATRDVVARQQTLRNTIAWSYELLNKDEQRFFRQLSVFVGGCMLEALEAICAAVDDGDGVVSALDRVASLTDKSLLQQTEQVDGEPRFMMLETIREYGLNCLTESGEENETRRAHAMYYLALAKEMKPNFIGTEQLKWMERLDREHDNMRSALNWMIEREEHEKALQLVGALWQFWVARDYTYEGHQWAEKALIGNQGVGKSILAKALNAAGDLALSQDYFDRAEMLGTEGLMLYQELGDKHGIATSLCLLGMVALRRGNSVVASALCEEGLALFRELGDKGGIAMSLNSLSTVALSQKDYTRAYSLNEESLVLCRESGDKLGVAYILRGMVILASYQGENTKAIALAEESLEKHRELGIKLGIANALTVLGIVVLGQGDHTKACSLLEEGLAFYRELGFKSGIAETLFSLGRVAFGQGNYKAACAYLEESLVIAKEVGNKPNIASCLEELAGVVAAQGEPTRAAQLWGAAQTLHDEVGTPISSVYRTDYEHTVAVARDITAAWVEGCHIVPEQAVAAREPVTMPTPAPTDQPSLAPTKPSLTYLDGLTAREVEVLHLIAKGLTDVQIAKHLVISPRTVNTHLTSIYSKIQVSSRSAATRYAMEHHLL